MVQAGWSSGHDSSFEANESLGGDVTMKYCPNPACSYLRRHPGRGPAEFLDRATVCNDCGIALVDRGALGSEDTARAVSSWHAERSDRAETSAPSSGNPGRLDVATGLSLIALSIALLVGSYVTAISMGGGSYFVAFGPFIYGMIRLTRGMDAQKAARTPK